MSLTTFFLFVSLLVSVSSENKHLSKANSLGSDIERHRYKRGLFDDQNEYQYFRQYFAEKGLEQEFQNAIQGKGRIDNWGSLGVKNYGDAVRSSTDFYAKQAGKGVNVETQLDRMDKIIDDRYQRASRYGGPDKAHQKVIDGWKEGRSHVKEGKSGSVSFQSKSNCGRKKRGIGALFRLIGRLIGRLASKGRSFKGLKPKYSGIRRSSTRRMRC
ncbi:uncharacterized protein LOC134267863 [Saccostrea cucullata]|uniref:uncharacterized protein LOC134267863 n=1 Tax=Saccostrea cuccullata TaxID=36930 RepID=UPI002ED4A8FD